MLIDVPNERLSGLKKEKAVYLVEELIHIDARESDIPLNIISFSSEIDTADGGIDGKVNGSDKKSKMGAIKKGITCYQIKSGNQRPIPSTIKKILRTNKGMIKPEIKNCFDNGGTLVIIFMGADSPIYKINKIYENLREYLPEYENPRLEIWVQTNIRQFLKPHPRLSFRILGVGDELFCSYREWARQEYMRYPRFLGRTQQKFIDRLRQMLPRRTREHIRVTGEPGIGKTRLVLEALRTEFSDKCLYIDNPRRVLDSDVFRHLTTRDDKSSAILVVDDCDAPEMVEIWNRVKHIPQIRLITIYNESGDNMRDMVNYTVPPLEDEQIIQILELYMPSHNADIWCKECRPSPRAAHIIGENLKSDTGDVLQSPSDVRVWDRYIASRTELDSQEFKERKKILLWLSLFKKFGERESYANEYKIIEDMLKDKVGILPATFSRTISKLKRMKILQGSSILYITPKVLHVWLWREWCKEYDMGLFPLDEMTNSAKSDMANSNVLAWHMDMLRYAKGTPGVSSIANNLFKPRGFADRHSLLGSHEGADLFYSASKADLEKAVNYLYRYMTNFRDKDELLGFNGQRQVAMVLTDAAMDRRLFERAARMLLLLAGTEGEQSFSGADQAFVRLFSPVPGSVGWTAMPPLGRLSMIEEALEYDASECRLLGIRACEAALQMQYYIRNIDDDEAWQYNKHWTPKFRSEYTEYYVRVLGIIRKHLERLEGHERSNLVKVVLSRTRDLLAIPELYDTVLSLLNTIHAKQYVDSEPIIKTISYCLMYGHDGMPANLRKNLEQLRDKATGSNYSSLLKRYVSMNITNDAIDEDDTYQKAIEKLAKQSLDVTRLEPELDWLVTDKAIYGHRLGCVLGKMDDGTLFFRIRDAQRRHGESKAVFLGGYLYAVFQRNVEEWESLMDSLVRDDILYSRVPALTHMSGMTDRAAARIRNLVMSKLEPTVLRDFVYGTLVRSMSEERFDEWMQLLADGNAETYEIALKLYHKYYVYGNMRIPESAKALLFPDYDINEVLHVSRGLYEWSATFTSYIKQNPDELDMIRKALKIMTNTSDIDSHRYDELLPALTVAAEQHPAKTWEIIADFIYPTKNRYVSLWSVRGLLSMDDMALVDKISPEVIFEWIDKDKEKRAPLMAFMIPNNIHTVIRFAAKYGKIRGVTKKLIGNLNTVPISGSISGKTVDSLMEKESDTVVLEFLQKYRDALTYGSGM